MGDPPVDCEVDLPVGEPYDAPGLFRFLAARAVDGVEAADVSRAGQLRYARTLVLPGGPAAVLVVASRDDRGPWALRVRLRLASPTDRGPAVVAVRRLLDLDTPAREVDSALAADEDLAPWVARTPGIRVPGAVEPHELVVRALVGQQISVAAARTHLGRLAGTLGDAYGPEGARAGIPCNGALSGIADADALPGHPDDAALLHRLDRLFPTAAQIAAGVPEPVAGQALDPERVVRLPGQAIRAVVGTCRALATGDLDVRADADPAVLRENLLARPRIGPWTASYLAMRVLGDPDAWLDGDVALLAGATTLGLLAPDISRSAAHRALAERAATWAPWRSYAAMHLWQVAASGGRM